MDKFIKFQNGDGSGVEYFVPIKMVTWIKFHKDTWYIKIDGDVFETDDIEFDPLEIEAHIDILRGV